MVSHRSEIGGSDRCTLDCFSRKRVSLSLSRSSLVLLPVPTNAARKFIPAIRGKITIFGFASNQSTKQKREGMTEGTLDGRVPGDSRPSGESCPSYRNRTPSVSYTTRYATPKRVATFQGFCLCQCESSKTLNHADCQRLAVTSLLARRRRPPRRRRRGARRESSKSVT